MYVCEQRWTVSQKMLLKIVLENGMSSFHFKNSSSKEHTYRDVREQGSISDIKNQNRTKQNMGQLYEVIDVLTSLLVVIIFQCIQIPNHHVVHLKHVQILFICNTSKSKGGKNTNTEG